MKGARCIFWILSACICLSEARYKMRRPPPHVALPPPQSYKKIWPISQRMSVGNTLHIGGNFGPKRQLYKPAGYRIRRPPMYNGLQSSWKNQVPVLGVINHAVLPQRLPVKEFHAMNKLPEYSPEYRPETVVMPPTHRDGMDDDKGAIHTIPAPNLSLADKPYNREEGNENREDPLSQHRYSNDGSYNPNMQGSHVTNFGFGNLMTSVAPHRSMTSPSSPENLYDVTESNEIGTQDYQTAQSTFYTSEFDGTRLEKPLNPDLQMNELFVKHPALVNGLKPGMVNTNVQFGQSNAPMQTNLHSSLHVGFPGTAAQAPSSLDSHQVSDLHVGHPAPAGPPLSATQLYDLLNSFPQQVNEQYMIGQQPQLQQPTLQQHIGQLFQSTGSLNSFSPPQMHSFNYDEQANKQQQQQQQQQKQILISQDYDTGRITADYNTEQDNPRNEQRTNIHLSNFNGNSGSSEELEYKNSEARDQNENYIGYEDPGNQRGKMTYVSNAENEDGVLTQFYTTLPNKEAAEKLAALAAAGNVNSHLIGQIRKQLRDQQEQQTLQDERNSEQSDEPMPTNNSHGEYEVNEPQDDDVSYDQQEHHQYRDQQEEQQHRYDEEQQLYDQQQYRRQRFKQQQQVLEHQYEQQKYINRQRQNADDELDENNRKPMRIMVPEDEKYSEEKRQLTASETGNTNEDYDYENAEPDVVDARTTFSSDDTTTYDQNTSSQFGARLTAIKPL